MCIRLLVINDQRDCFEDKRNYNKMDESKGMF